MISFVYGKIAEKTPTYVIIDKGGIGIFLLISLTTFETLGDIGSDVKLVTHLHVKEDALILFGFTTRDERELFLHLMSVNGVGPKLALSILSGASISELYQYIASGNEAALTRIKGLGKKTAQRIILDLKTFAQKKSGELAVDDTLVTVSNTDLRDEAVLALSALGFSQQEADKAVTKAMLLEPDCENVETLIRVALNS